MKPEQSSTTHATEGDPTGPDDEGQWVHGVVSPDRSEAVYACVRLETSPSATGGRIRLQGLDPGRRYTLVRRDEAGLPSIGQRRPPAWWSSGQLTTTGAVLSSIGIAGPVLNPGQGLLLHVRAG